MSKKGGITKKIAKAGGKMAVDMAKDTVISTATSVAVDTAKDIAEEKKLKEKAFQKTEEVKKKLDESGAVDRVKVEADKKLAKLKRKKDQ
ncbi:MAG: hypothetical protein ACFFB3_15680 [Candidatus Hodarchaeota archaeon]